ncbi:MAG: DNA polymerase III subunit chi [Rhodospirillales bacterium]|nr:DNA polymerase III subunit chi [Rhodospirillales bacterium]
MAEVSFYHLQKSRLEDALPMLLEKTLAAGKRALVLTSSETRAEQLGDALWSYRQDSWLPHGSKKEGRAEDQPIWLSAEDENANDAAFIFLTDGAVSANLDAFERCFELFDGNDGAQITAARERWKTYRDAGYGLKYLQQSENGGWQEKAASQGQPDQ